MAQPDNNTQLSSAFNTFFERETLTGVNFNDWYCSLRIVLRVADTYEYLYKPCPNQPLETDYEEDEAAWKVEYKKHNDVACLMLGKIAVSVNGVFETDMNNNVSKNNNNFIFSINKKRKIDLDSSYLWHYRLAQIGKTRMHRLQREGLFESINDESFDKCESCISGKMTKKHFNNNIERATDLHGLIHTDLCEKLRHVSRKGASYFLTFTDDFSQVELQLGKKIKALRSNKGGEYLSQEFKDYLSKNGIVQHLTSPYTPQQNGVSERRNHTLLDMVRSMFNLTTLPLSFCDYALESAVCILNMVPTKKVDKTPYEIWHGKAPNLSYLKVWCCEAYVKRDSANKLHQRSVKCIFVGYPKKTMGYYFYFPPENKVIVVRYGNFLERDLISQKFSGRDNDLEDDHIDTLPSENTSKILVKSESLGSPPELIPVRRSERTMRAPNRLCLNIEVKDDEVGDLREPANYKFAMLDPDKTFLLMPRIDYEETFSPVEDIRAIRILIAIAAYYDYKIWQMDVKTAFLNGRLDEDIYMEQPEGYVDPKYPNRVCKLQSSIYGLKQASRQWNKRFDEKIKKFIFIQNRDDPCVYHKASGSDVGFLILYVDDILIMGNNIPRLKEVKDYLGKCFSMKDLGEATHILGIKIYKDRSRRLIRLSQSAYIEKILKKYNMHNSKKGYLPTEVKHDLSNELCASTPEEVAYMKKVPYASAVGSIMYAVRCTWPDVAFAQNLVSRYQQNPRKLHWVAVKHILKYLRNTRDMFLVYGGKPDTELDVTGFYDASWQCDKDDTKSQMGYVFVVNGGAVDWKSKKQTTIAMHSAQAEYVAASEAVMEAVWIRKFGHELTLRVLFRLFGEAEADHDFFSSTTATSVYEMFLLKVAKTLRDSFPPNDKSLTRLRSEVPYLPKPRCLPKNCFTECSAPLGGSANKSDTSGGKQALSAVNDYAKDMLLSAVNDDHLMDKAHTDGSNAEEALIIL
nr:retrotransposon protein, putative, Ty1-copia subclass [Tanacetum cinerariifolium]